MTNMSYCRHENTHKDLKQVWEDWDNFEPETASYQELKARRDIIELVKDMATEFEEGYRYTDNYLKDDIEEARKELYETEE